MSAGPLGRLEPVDRVHEEKYPLRALGAQGIAELNPTPVVLGVNWYSNFDTPVLDGRRWWIGRGDLGAIRGGHAICAAPSRLGDYAGWRAHYDQGREGACVGFAVSRTMTLLNRRRYDAQRLYKRAQQVDEWEGEAYSGTSVRAGLEVARTEGLWPDGGALPNMAAGISEYRWALTVDEVLATLKSPFLERLGAVQLLNSWGLNYPHRVYLPLETLDRLLREGGEAGLVVDRP